MKALSSFVFLFSIITLTGSASAQKKQASSQSKKQTISSYNASQQNDITVGGRLGLTFSQFEASGAGAIDYTPNAGLMIGGEVNMWMSKDMALVGQLLYVKKSATSVQRNGELTFSTSYLEIPLYAKYRFGNDNIRPHVFAGPAVGFNLSANAKAELNNGQSVEDEIEGWSSVDIGLNFGAGVSMKLNSSMDLTFDLGYAIGLNSIGRDQHAYGYHTGFRMMTGVQVPLR